MSYQKEEFSICHKDEISGEKKVINADIFLIATGVAPNTENLGIENTSIQRDEKGFIKVNKHLKTQERHIWAFGDCTGPPFLRHLANFEVDYLLETLFDKMHQKSIDYSSVPHAIFSNPQIAGVGKTERELQEEHIPFIVGVCHYKDVARASAMRSCVGFVKLLFAKRTRVLLGAHIIGEDAATLCHILIPFLKSRSKAEDIRDMIYIHPTLPEAIRDAARNVF